MVQTLKIGIIGGGIGGLTTAIALQRAGYQVTVFETLPEIRTLGSGIVLAANAIKALEQIGIAPQIIAAGKALRWATILDHKGNPISETDTFALSEKYTTTNFAIHRADLQRILIGELQANTLQLDKKCTDIQAADGRVYLSFADKSEYEFDAVIASDGTRSFTRRRIFDEIEPKYAGYGCWRATINVPAALADKYDWTRFSETWSTKGRFGIVPLLDNRIYWYACLNAPTAQSLKQFTVTDLLRQFLNHHAPIPDIIEATPPEALIYRGINDLPPLETWTKDHILLLGDAAHATTPNLGQGACQAIEDALVLRNCLQKENTVQKAFFLFETRRRDRTEKVQRLSRRIGALAQLESNSLAYMRNVTLRAVPASVNEKQLRFLFEVDFEV